MMPRLMLSRCARTPLSPPHSHFPRLRPWINQRLISTGGKRHVLNTGASIPALGFGTFQDAGAQEDAVTLALCTGYRHIDTAQVYDTEIQVGNGIKRSGVPRDEIFLATKLWCNSYHPDDVEASLDQSLAKMTTPYVDLLLMHYPCTFVRGDVRMPTGPDGKFAIGETTYVDTWRAMEKLMKSGKVRAIGVSNFSPKEVNQILDQCEVVPAVHQLELHPYLQQPEFVKWHKDNNILITQFSPLGNNNDFYRSVEWAKPESQMSRLIEHPTLAEVAKKHSASPVQIALAWGINGGRSVLTKSVIEWQIKENLAAASLQLSEDDMRTIATMDIKVRFNDPSQLYRWQLYEGLDGFKQVTTPL